MSEKRKAFPFDEFEPRWQQYWEVNKTYRSPGPGDADFDATKPKFYVLDMFPYPSGAGLHVGHPEGYTATDIVSRYQRMKGCNVLHPMGWDAFGLPAEQFAIKTGQHPRVTTERNVARFREQLKRIGFDYDWDREVNTTDPGYFKWTQWIFLQLYHSYLDEGTRRARPVSELEAQGLSRAEIDARRLAYVSEAPVNWCPGLGTVLANEEVIDGKSEVGGFPVKRRPMRQWMLRITAFAQRLIDELDGLDWPDSIKLHQRNWIGRSEGAEVKFEIRNSKPGIRNTIAVFTTRPDTLFGATYMVLSPEHPLVDEITTPDQREAVATYRAAIGGKSDLERTDLAKDKTGVWTGAHAVNPVNDESIPVWIADYVLMGYGTGAIMAVPAHDERDFEFAKKFGLPIREVVRVAGASSPQTSAASAGGLEAHTTEPAPYVWSYGKHLPQLTRDGSLYAVSFRLGDSLPAPVFKAMRAERDELLARVEASELTLSPPERERLDHLLSEKVEAYLDAGHGACHLRDPRIARIVQDALHHFDSNRYELIAWCIMPNHVHVVFKPLTHQLSSILHSWKSFTAGAANSLLGLAGTFWQEESYDHLIRDEDDFAAQIAYLLRNPAAAGLKDWPWVGYSGRWIGEPVAGASSPQESTTGDCGLEAHTTVATAFCDDGVAVNSGFLNGLPTAEARQRITAWLEEKGLGRGMVNYKLRDWLFSRQRYWGEPFPVVWEDGQHRAVPERELPVLPPELEDFKPTGTPEPPLSKAVEWVRYSDKAVRELNTMPQWAGSCWYYLRFCDPRNAAQFVGTEAERYWMARNGKPGGVDLYVGGIEHAVLHLLYARFWHKVLFDLGHVSTPEPFQKLVNQGLVLGEDGQKMSKSQGNVVSPDEVIDSYGADSLRLYEMFMGPLEQVKPWSMKGVEGVHRFLARVWRLCLVEQPDGSWSWSQAVQDVPPGGKLRTLQHETIRKVTDDIKRLAFNTAISQMMVLTNALVTEPVKPARVIGDLLKLLSPFAPHLAEELWSRLALAFPSLRTASTGNAALCSHQSWPVFDPAALVVDEIEIVVQVNGKLRDKVTIHADAGSDAAEAAALASPRIKEVIGAGTVMKVIVVPKKLVNIVVK